MATSKLLGIGIDPPLINSANPWATHLDQLRELYECPFTGAITIRTSTLNGFEHNDDVHQYTFYDVDAPESKSSASLSVGSLNTLGYSPIPLAQTLENVSSIINESVGTKPVIISITGSVEEIKQCIEQIDRLQAGLDVQLLVEVNLSCPNIGNKPPPAFTLAGLIEYLSCIQNILGESKLKFGIKLPPYSNPDNFNILNRALLHFVDREKKQLNVPLDFITATNTLGCSLLLDKNLDPQLNSTNGTGIGGLAGAPLHPLALGNVKMIRSILDSEVALSNIKIIGIGGVSDHAGFRRMQHVGAEVVGVGTAFGSKGISIFEKILDAD